MPSRRDFLLRLVAGVAALCSASPARAQAWLGTGWSRLPTIAVLSAPGDARLPLVRGAVTFWNSIFAEIGSAFRLGPAAETVGSIPVGELMTLQHSGPAPLPDGVRTAPGNIVIALSDGNFISFTRRWPEAAKALVAIKSERFYPMTLPNVTRNVIAHELGHAIALGHNSDPAMLMCGRPASCRPDAFASSTEHYFPLTADERALLLRLYPADWRSR